MSDMFDGMFDAFEKDFEDFERRVDDFLSQESFKKVRKKMSHTIYICIPNDKDQAERIFAKIGSLGVSIAPADKSNTLLDGGPAATTIMAITASNFKDTLSNSQITDYVIGTIKDFEYYGIVVKNSNGSSSWRRGNVQKLAKQKDEPKEDAKPEPEPKTEPEPSPILKTNSKKLEDFGEVDYAALLLKVVEKSTEISDVFFDGISRDDRILLSRKLKEAMSSS